MINRSRRSRIRDTVVFGVSVKSGGGAAYVPLLTAAADGTPTSDGATGASVDTDTGNGRLYWAAGMNGYGAKTYGDSTYGTAKVVATSGQIKAGSGADIVVSGNQVVSVNGSQIISNITGLVASTTYRIKFLQTSAANIDSAQASVELITTA